MIVRSDVNLRILLHRDVHHHVPSASAVTHKVDNTAVSGNGNETGTAGLYDGHILLVEVDTIWGFKRMNKSERKWAGTQDRRIRQKEWHHSLGSRWRIIVFQCCLPAILASCRGNAVAIITESHSGAEATFSG